MSDAHPFCRVLCEDLTSSCRKQMHPGACRTGDRPFYAVIKATPDLKISETDHCIRTCYKYKQCKCLSKPMFLTLDSFLPGSFGI